MLARSNAVSASAFKRMDSNVWEALRTLLFVEVSPAADETGFTQQQGALQLWKLAQKFLYSEQFSNFPDDIVSRSDVSLKHVSTLCSEAPHFMKLRGKVRGKVK